MMDRPAPSPGILTRLARDASGNTIALIAAALVPLVAMLGGGVDMGRAYVTQTRLQQACDAGVLAARKRLGSDLPPSDQVVGKVRQTGQEFFDLNFNEGRYDTEDRIFQMVLESDYSITGNASATMPTALMGIFGYNEIPIEVTCTARQNYSNLDIVMAIDVTGSMRHTNPGDSESRLDSVRSVIRRFHTNLNASKTPETRIRYGFVPYSSNVNVGHLLQNNWVVNNWTYQSREVAGTTTTTGTETVYTNWRYVSGTRSSWSMIEEYAATPVPGSSDTLECSGTQPGNTLTVDDEFEAPREAPYLGPPSGTQQIEDAQRTENGTRYRTRLNGDTCVVEEMTYTNFVNDFQRITRPRNRTTNTYNYLPIARNVNQWRTQTEGCIEERASSIITDYDNVDLSVNLDLDIDTVPSASDPDTQWRPRYPQISYTRQINGSGNGSFSPDPVMGTTSQYAKTGEWWMSACPAPSSRLAVMDTAELDSYLGTLAPFGATYHDIGMIWAGRLISPDGLFASANADVSANQPTTRHVIFLTDGQTEPYDVAYTAYGIEPIDGRRWNESTSMTLPQTIEARFLFACNEVKKKNTTVWVIAFGTYANDAMKECAGNGRYFEASDSTQLDDAFTAIAQAMGDLRISN